MFEPDKPWDGCPYHYTEMSPPEHYEMCKLHPDALYGIGESDCVKCSHSKWAKEHNESLKPYYDWLRGGKSEDERRGGKREYFTEMYDCSDIMKEMDMFIVLGKSDINEARWIIQRARYALGRLRGDVERMTE